MASKLDINESALGSIIYKDSLINIKITLPRLNGSNDYINADIYYLNNINGNQHPELYENNLIANCFLKFHHEQLRLISVNLGKRDGKVIDRNL